MFKDCQNLDMTPRICSTHKHFTFSKLPTKLEKVIFIFHLLPSAFRLPLGGLC